MEHNVTDSRLGKARSWARFGAALGASVMITTGLCAWLAAQSKPTPEPTPPSPNADKAAMTEHFKKAQQIAQLNTEISALK